MQKEICFVSILAENFGLKEHTDSSIIAYHTFATTLVLCENINYHQSQESLPIIFSLNSSSGVISFFTSAERIADINSTVLSCSEFVDE